LKNYTYANTGDVEASVGVGLLKLLTLNWEELNENQINWCKEYLPYLLQNYRDYGADAIAAQNRNSALYDFMARSVYGAQCTYASKVSSTNMRQEFYNYVIESNKGYGDFIQNVIGGTTYTATINGYTFSNIDLKDYSTSSSVHWAPDADLDYSSINGVIPNAISNLNKNVDNSMVYSREYVLNLQNSFENEKSELLYKINFLQNNLERIKSTFSREILRLQNEQSDEFKKNQVKENEMNFKFNSIISEKNEKLNKLNEENLNLKNINDNLNNKLEDYNSNNIKNQNAFNNKLENLNNEIKNLQEEKNVMQKNHINRINEIIKNNTKEIKEIEEKKQKKLDDI
jgi:hypothetical protein